MTDALAARPIIFTSESMRQSIEYFRRRFELRQDIRYLRHRVEMSIQVRQVVAAGEAARELCRAGREYLAIQELLQEQAHASGVLENGLAETLRREAKDVEAPRCGEGEPVRPGHDVMATFTDGRDAELLRVTGSPQLNGIFAIGSADFIVEAIDLEQRAPFRVRAMTLRPIARVFGWEKEAKLLTDGGPTAHK